VVGRKFLLCGSYFIYWTMRAAGLSVRWQQEVLVGTVVT